MTEDISKLPKWAQNRIAKLESDCTYYKDRMETVMPPAAENADLVVRHVSDRPLMLPPSSRICFRLPGGLVEVCFASPQETLEPRVHVHVSSLTGIAEALISPRYSNSFLVGIKP